jgi:hypothetical protein
VIRCYTVHGVTIRVTSDSGTGVQQRISQKLHSFQSETTGSPDLEFQFDEVAAIGANVPPPAGRRVYDLERGEACYFPVGDLLTADYEGNIRMICDIARGNTRYQMVPGEEAIRAATNILFTLPLIELLRRQGFYNLHAAGVCRNGNALLLAGSSGTGKSTLTLELTRRGWDYLADDMVFLKPGCDDVFGFPEGIDYFAGCKSKHHIRPELAFGSAALLRAAARALVFPHVAMTVKSCVEPITPTQAFLELAPNVLITKRTVCEEHFAVLERLTRSVPAFRLHTGTDFNEASQLLDGLLEAC